MCVQNKRNVARSEPRNVLTNIRFVIEPPGSGSWKPRTQMRNVEPKNRQSRYRRCIPQTFANHQSLTKKFGSGVLGKLGWCFAGELEILPSDLAAEDWFYPSTLSGCPTVLAEVVTQRLLLESLGWAATPRQPFFLYNSGPLQRL